MKTKENIFEAAKIKFASTATNSDSDSDLFWVYQTAININGTPMRIENNVCAINKEIVQYVTDNIAAYGPKRIVDDFRSWMMENKDRLRFSDTRVIDNVALLKQIGTVAKASNYNDDNSSNKVDIAVEYAIGIMSLILQDVANPHNILEDNTYITNLINANSIGFDKDPLYRLIKTDIKTILNIRLSNDIKSAITALIINKVDIDLLTQLLIISHLAKILGELKSLKICNDLNSDKHNNYEQTYLQIWFANEIINLPTTVKIKFITNWIYLIVTESNSKTLFGGDARVNSITDNLMSLSSVFSDAATQHMICYELLPISDDVKKKHDVFIEFIYNHLSKAKDKPTNSKDNDSNEFEKYGLAKNNDNYYYRVDNDICYHYFYYGDMFDYDNVYNHFGDTSIVADHALAFTSFIKSNQLTWISMQNYEDSSFFASAQSSDPSNSIYHDFGMAIYNSINSSSVKDVIDIDISAIKLISEMNLNMGIKNPVMGINAHMPENSLNTEYVAIPADLIIGDTIPMSDINIRLDSDAELEKGIRIKIFDADDRTKINNIFRSISDSKSDLIPVGALIISGEDSPDTIGINLSSNSANSKTYFAYNSTIYPLWLDKSNNMIYLFGLSYKLSQLNYMKQLGKSELTSSTIFCANNNSSHNDIIVSSTDYWDENYDVIMQTLYLWYGVQLLLLNPNTVERVSQFKPVANKPTATKKKKKPVIKYTRVHYINGDELEPMLYTRQSKDGSRTFERKCKCWYVIGHYRHYTKTDKTIFIQGYWKGELRQLKVSEETRQREIVDE